MVQDTIWKSDIHSPCQKQPAFFMESEVSLMSSQMPATGPYPEIPNPVHPTDIYLLKVHINTLLPTLMSLHWSNTIGTPNQIPVNSPLTHACHISSPLRPPWLYHLKNIRWRIQAMKFIIMQFHSRSVFLPFRPKCPPQNSVFKSHRLCSSL
jgi:hypothetical protein